MSGGSFSESDWEMLIAFIQDRSVIPVIGNGLSQVLTQEGFDTIPFEKWLSLELSKRLGRSPSESLDEIVGSMSAAGGNIRGLYPLIRNLVQSAPFDPPDSLLKLASIRDFPLFVTTTFDGLLAKALENEFGNTPQHYSYSPKQIEDLPGPINSLAEGAIYHLFGKIAPTSRYAICDEDVLEWISALQSETYAPELLVSELQKHHLLLIGVDYPDWLGRFFVRTAKRRRLSEDREWFEFIVQPDSSGDQSLASFLRNVSRNTFVIGDHADPVEFVNELHKRWAAGGSPPAPSRVTKNSGPVRFLPPSREMPTDSIFISYSRGDIESVKRLKAGLDEQGFTSWFDLDQLAAGDDYPTKIRRNIEQCTYFIPIISLSAIEREEAFFYREWAWALERRKGMGHGAIFILPVIVDDCPARHPRLEEITRNCDVSRLPNGVADERFNKRLNELLRPVHV